MVGHRLVGRCKIVILQHPYCRQLTAIRTPLYKGKENMPICNRHCGLPPGGRLEDIKVFRVSKVFKAPKVPKVSETPKVFKVAADKASVAQKR